MTPLDRLQLAELALQDAVGHLCAAAVDSPVETATHAKAIATRLRQESNNVYALGCSIGGANLTADLERGAWRTGCGELLMRTPTTNQGVTMHTNATVLTAHGVDLASIEIPELEIPVVVGNQRQGDVLILKVTTNHAGAPLGKGVTVVRAETDTANTHTLVGDGLWEPNARANREGELVQGWLTVPHGGEAFLIHTEEHSALGIGEGTYEIRRQREFAGEWRQVAD